VFGLLLYLATLLPGRSFTAARPSERPATATPASAAA
jgi:hypothetical protein